MQRRIYIEKEMDDENSFFVQVPMILAKRTKTYPRIRGWFSFRKEDKISYPRFKYLDSRTHVDNEIDPLVRNEWKEFHELQGSFDHSNIFYFVFDVKRDNHCRIDYIGCNSEYRSVAARKETDIYGLFWQNEIYRGLMKDRQSLRTLTFTQIERLFKQKFFWDTVLAEYIFAGLKL